MPAPSSQAQSLSMGEGSVLIQICKSGGPEGIRRTQKYCLEASSVPSPASGAQVTGSQWEALGTPQPTVYILWCLHTVDTCL